MSVTALDTRRVTLGGSTIGAACGIDPWCSPIRLWCELTGRLTREPTEAMRWGTRLQPVIMEALLERYPRITTARTYDDPERHWLAGHPDGLLASDETLHRAGSRTPQGVLEVKASARGYETPPVHYLAQVQTYMHLTGLDHAVIATLAGLHLDVTDVERSQHQIDLLLALGERFMRYVWDDVQPPPEGHPDDRGALVQLFPEATPRKVRETKEVRDARRELAVLMEREKASKARMESLRAVVQNHMQDADTLVSAHDDVTATFRNVTARRIDTARLRKERPDVYELYAQPQTTRRLLLT